MIADVLNQKNEKVGTVEISAEIFGAKWNPILVHQVYQSQLSNQRSVIADTKGRGEVRGGGKKPWKQKHTGRSRHSSIRSPLWKGGGVTFGPTSDRNFEKKINKAMKKTALYSVLSKKMKMGQVKILDSMDMQSPKTKKVAEWLKSLQASRSVIMVPGKENKTSVIRAGKNIERCVVRPATSLNIREGLEYRYIIFEQSALAELTRV